jgi:hypothetical protein
MDRRVAVLDSILNRSIPISPKFEPEITTGTVEHAICSLSNRRVHVELGFRGLLSFVIDQNMPGIDSAVTDVHRILTLIAG